MVKSTVAAIITETNGDATNVLLARRNTEPYKGFWSLPGGHIEPYETARDAIIREIREEIGIDFEPTFFCYFDEMIPEKAIHAVVIVFCGTSKGKPDIRKEEISEIAWLPCTQAQSMPLAFLQNKILDMYVSATSQGDNDD